MRAITEAYGPEEGMRLWETIADTLGPDIKGEIFLSMITGEYTDKIRIKGVTGNLVATIKAFRQYDRRRLGLKEAKDLADLVMSGRQIDLDVNPRDRVQIERELINIGCKLA